MMSPWQALATPCNAGVRPCCGRPYAPPRPWARCHRRPAVRVTVESQGWSPGVCFVCILFHRDSNADHWGLKQSNPRGVQEDKMGILANHGGSRPAKMPRQAWASRFDYQTRRTITLFPDSVRVTAGSQELMSSAAWDRMSLQPAEDLNGGVCRYCGQK
jgi:hypothetical protein